MNQVDPANALEVAVEVSGGSGTAEVDGQQLVVVQPGGTAQVRGAHAYKGGFRGVAWPGHHGAWGFCTGTRTPLLLDAYIILLQPSRPLMLADYPPLAPWVCPALHTRVQVTVDVTLPGSAPGKPGSAADGAEVRRRHAMPRACTTPFCRCQCLPSCNSAPPPTSTACRVACQRTRTWSWRRWPMGGLPLPTPRCSQAQAQAAQRLEANTPSVPPLLFLFPPRSSLIPFPKCCLTRPTPPPPQRACTFSPRPPPTPFPNPPPHR